MFFRRDRQFFPLLFLSIFLLYTMNLFYEIIFFFIMVSQTWCAFLYGLIEMFFCGSNINTFFYLSRNYYSLTLIWSKLYKFSAKQSHSSSAKVPPVGISRSRFVLYSWKQINIRAVQNINFVFFKKKFQSVIQSFSSFHIRYMARHNIHLSLIHI